MWLNHMQWKEDFQVDTILQDFYFGERDKFLICFPQGYHKTDKMVRVPPQHSTTGHSHNNISSGAQQTIAQSSSPSPRRAHMRRQCRSVSKPQLHQRAA